MLGLVGLGVVLVVGGVVVSIAGVDLSDAVTKSLAVIVGAVVALASSSQLRQHDD